jgi:signal transduction histidine kinase
MDISARKRAEEDLQKREEQLWEVLGERGQLSQDLHDNIIQRIYAVGLNLEESHHLMAEDSKAVSTNLERAIVDLNGVIREVRDYISRVDPGIISAMQLRAELAKLVQDTQGILLPRFRLKLDPIAVTHLTTEQAKQVLFIVREALSNSLRHSQARTGLVSLRTKQDSLRLEITDDGIGFDNQDGGSSGHGLRNMAARAKTLGSQLEIFSATGQGTRIILDIPKE